MKPIEALSHVNVLGIEIDLGLAQEAREVTGAASIRFLASEEPPPTSWNAALRSGCECWTQFARQRITSKQSAGTDTSTAAFKRKRTTAAFAAAASIRSSSLPN